MTIVIPTETINKRFNPNDATPYDEDSEEARVYAAVKRTEAKIDVNRPLAGFPFAVAHGSGTVVTRDGIILTDRHCVTAADAITPLSDDQITVTVNGKTYHAHVLPDNHRLGIRSDQAVLQIIPNTPGERFEAMRIASRVRPGAQQYVFGYPQGSERLFIAPVKPSANETVVRRSDLNKAKEQPGEDPNRELTESIVHIEPGNSGGAKVQIGSDGRPELVAMAEITNTDHNAQVAAAAELAKYAQMQLRDDERVVYVDESGQRQSDLYGHRRQFLEQQIIHPNSAGWFTPRQSIVSFLDDVTGRRFGEESNLRADVAPPERRNRRGAWLPQTTETRRTEPMERASQGQYVTIAEQILAAHAKQSVESYALKQFMG
jgi:hypothetical protein